MEALSHDGKPLDHGYFVDLAANEPFENSNTQALERNFAWQGLCIDVNKQLLDQLRSGRSCNVIDAVVSNTSGMNVTFREFVKGARANSAFAWMHGLSGVVASDSTLRDSTQPNNLQNRTCWGRKRVAPAEKRKCVDVSGQRGGKWLARHPGINVREIVRQTISLYDLLQAHRAPRVIDYLSLDVEGSEHVILSTFPFQAYTFRTLTIEQPPPQTKKLLRQHSYHYIGRLGPWDGSGDELWVHGSIQGGVTACRRRVRARVHLESVFENEDLSG